MGKHGDISRLEDSREEMTNFNEQPACNSSLLICLVEKNKGFCCTDVLNVDFLGLQWLLPPHDVNLRSLSLLATECLEKLLGTCSMSISGDCHDVCTLTNYECEVLGGSLKGQ